MEGTAVNVIKFNVRGLNLFSGKLIIEASFKISSKSVKPFYSFLYLFFSFLFFLTLVSVPLFTGQ